jgi:hypothetical protein
MRDHSLLGACNFCDDTIAEKAARYTAKGANCPFPFAIFAVEFHVSIGLLKV